MSSTREQREFIRELLKYAVESAHAIGYAQGALEMMASLDRMFPGTIAATGVFGEQTREGLREAEQANLYSLSDMRGISVIPAGPSWRVQIPDQIILDMRAIEGQPPPAPTTDVRAIEWQSPLVSITEMSEMKPIEQQPPSAPTTEMSDMGAV